MIKKTIVTGGAGYVGSALVPALLDDGQEVVVFDKFWFGNPFKNLRNEGLKLIEGDIRDGEKLRDAASGCDAMIHLACISNDPSFNFLDPRIGRSINLDAFENVIDAVNSSGIERLIYASSSSVYGVKEEQRVTEDLPAQPLTDYSRFKLQCEDILSQEWRKFEHVIVRPATVCGYAQRLRLDLMVNSFTIDGLTKGAITIGGGTQQRPNIHIHDMVRAYLALLCAPSEKVKGQTFNVGYENLSLDEIAGLVKRVVPNVQVRHVPTNDLRSYRVDSEKIRNVLGFEAQHTTSDAVNSIVEAYNIGHIINPQSSVYYNLARLKELKIS